MPKTLYLANPYGFSAQQKAGPLAALVDALTAVGAEVWEPFARNGQLNTGATGWGRPTCATCAGPTASSPWSTAARRTRG